MAYVKTTHFWATLAVALLLLTASFTQVRPASLSDDEVANLSKDIVFSNPQRKLAALEKLKKRGKQDVLAALIQTLRFSGSSPELLDTIQTLAGDTSIKNWSDAMLWQEGKSDLVPHSSFMDIKLTLLNFIDPAFLKFFEGEQGQQENMKIRFEEITWGGVPVDGIPSLDNPQHIEAKNATYLKESDLVFGVSINGDVRAYPLRIMGWHEMFNETIGGVPVALAYCTLCGSGILFETQVKGREKPFVFGSSGFLYRSNKLMFDRETNSLWNQFTGQPVVGPLVNTDVKLKIRPVLITSWKDWKTNNPDTKVLSLNTGHSRDYGSGAVYKEYFSSPDLMFPARVRTEKDVLKKEYVYGIREVGAARAWPLKAFKKTPVINDKIGGKNLVLIGNAQTRSVRAYESDGHIFTAGLKPGTLTTPDGVWKIREDFIEGPNGEKLSRIAGHISYWFAWDGYLGLKSSLYKP